MNYQQIVNNIKKLMDFWGFNLSELANKSGLTLNGLRHMLAHGKFKYESLFKIAETLQVPVVVLMADDLSVQQNIDGREYNTIIIRWFCNDLTGIKTILKGRKSLLSVVCYQSEKSQNKDDEIEIINLRTELMEKKEKIKKLEENLEMANNVVNMATKVTESYENYIGQLEYLISEMTGLEFPEHDTDNKTGKRMTDMTEKFISDILKKKKKKR
ncbi:MAG TPA: hypothetical protein PLH40_07510 [Bacteroidales bacterium]|nr:hypothetical protein [Bacteroidales bacterium]